MGHHRCPIYPSRSQMRPGGVEKGRRGRAAGGPGRGAGRRAGGRVGRAAGCADARAGRCVGGRAGQAGVTRTAGRPGGRGEGAELPPGLPLAGVRPPCAVHIVSSSCRATAAAASHNPTGRRCNSGRCRRSARQSARRSLRESCSHEARGQACCQSSRAISTLEREDNLERADTPFAKTRTRSKQTISVNMARYGRLHKNHQVLGEYGQMNFS